MAKLGINIKLSHATCFFHYIFHAIGFGLNIFICAFHQMIIQTCVLFVATVTYFIVEWDIRYKHYGNTGMHLNDSADENKRRQGALNDVKHIEQSLSQSEIDSNKIEEDPVRVRLMVLDRDGVTENRQDQ